MSSSNDSLAMQRITKLVDENSFMEIGSLVTARNTDFNLADTDTPSDGVITGYGLIDGNLVYVYSQDASVLNGTIGEMHAKKIANVYDMAMKMGAPVIGFIDCAGMRLQESVDALDGFGRIYAKEIEASGVIPQISAVFGNCGGGLAVVPALSDFAFMDEVNDEVDDSLEDYSEIIIIRALAAEQQQQLLRGGALRPGAAAERDAGNAG